MRVYSIYRLLQRSLWSVKCGQTRCCLLRYHGNHHKHLNFCATMNHNQEPLRVKLDERSFKSILTPELLTVKKLFDDHGHEVRIVGGAVRDLLMGKHADDLDLCTPATPDEMKVMYEQAGIRILTLSGVKHGTISIRVNDKQNFEVTTLRIDIQTDGRHAVVKFTKDWRLDALRRDLTINSLFLDFDGYIHDYLNGIEDVKNRRVCFVDDPDKRIQEDYLRILRYFRFYGRIADDPNKHDGSILESIKRNAHGLEGVSGERIWVELRKIILGRYPDSIMKTMHQLGVTQYIGIPDNIDLETFTKVCEKTRDCDPEVMTRMAALFTDQQQFEPFASRIRFSNKEKNLCAMILDYRDEVDTQDIESIKKHVCLNLTETRNKFVHQMSELCKYNGDISMAEKVMDFDFPFCPVSLRMLTGEKRVRRKYVNIVMNHVCGKWIESGYSLDKTELMGLVDQFIHENMEKYENLLYPAYKKKVK